MGFARQFNIGPASNRHARESRHPGRMLVALLLDSGFRGCRFSLKQPFETAAEKRGLLRANGVGIEFKGLYPFVLRSRRNAAASRRAVWEKSDTPWRDGVSSSSPIKLPATHRSRHLDPLLCEVLTGRL
jgi:hypothetical protein